MRLLRLSDTLAAIGVGKSQLYKYIKEGTFPSLVKLGRAAAWPEGEIREWIEARVAERDSKVPRSRQPGPAGV